nr:EOG090X09Q6 [Lepidurus arcticus]
MEDNEAKPRVSFKRVIRYAAAGRKRTTQEDEEDQTSSSEDETTVVKGEKRRVAGKPLKQSTSALKKKRTVAQGESTDEEKGPSSVTVAYQSSGKIDVTLPRDAFATSTNDVDTEQDRDAQAVFERALKVNKDLKGKEDDKIYRGLSAYTQYYEKKDTVQGNAASGGVRHGPMRASANVRTTVRWDYAPDICKDYKETGFCGFGDSCKFLHDRSDYKFGWQLELEGDKKGGEEDLHKYEIPDDEDELPFKCFICRDSFKNPIVTRCKHYFCEVCALKHYKKTTRCFVCNAQTNGVFNPAKAIVEKLKETEDEEVKSSQILNSDDEVDQDDT